MIANRIYSKYWNGVDEFIKFAVEHAENSNCIKYLCIKCACAGKVTVEMLRDQLFINGIDQGYTRWIKHGENAREDMPFNLNKKVVIEEKLTMRVIN